MLLVVVPGLVVGVWWGVSPQASSWDAPAMPVRSCLSSLASGTEPRQSDGVRIKRGRMTCCRLASDVIW